MVTGASHPAPSEDAPLAGQVAEPATSTVIADRYTLVEVIGEGGMGSVYRAEQTEPVKRQVALKLIKGGADSKAVLARFDVERQALALMDHPNIARVYDGGTTAAGQPFFVMELVRGVPLTQYCDQKRLSVRARLELFVQVCQAVQHAHQKGIIHRDLKPGNVLVTEVDGRPTPKVIDFGVAKATEVRLTDMSYADTGAIVGTPAYMSPEQADPASRDIDTRTDVYAMGVMLYELLVGSPPLDARQFKRGAILEMLRMVREVDPPRPSTKLSAAENLPNIAANRDIEPAKLAKSLRGELDWVVMKALEKDRTRRYDTAAAFALDLQRYLADEVVEARPPSAGYRLRKFVRRHKGQVIAAGLVFFALVAGMAGTTWGLFEAREQERVARGETAEKDKARLAEIEQRNLALGRADDLKYQLGVSSMVLASAAYDNHDVVLADERLEKVPEEQRGWEWRYLKQQTRGGLFTLYGHTSAVLGVAFSPDGERIVTAGEGVNRAVEVKVWDARTGTAVFEPDGIPRPQRGDWDNQVFSLGGTRLATVGQENTARVWDARTGKLQWEAKHTSPVARVALSPDGVRLATVCLDGTVKVWDAETGKPQWEFKGTGEWVRVWFNPDGSRIVIRDQEDESAKVWDARAGKPLCELIGNAGRALAFSPDGKRILTNSPSQAKVWDAQKGGPPLVEIQAPRDQMGGASISLDGKRILTGSLDETAQVWDAGTGTRLFSLKGRRGPKTIDFWALDFEGWQAAAFTPDGTRIVTVGGQNGAYEAIVWDAREGAELLALTGHTSQVLCGAFSPDGTRIVTGSQDGTAKVWDARTGEALLELNGKPPAMWTVSFSRDGTRIVTGNGSGTTKVWDAGTGNELPGEAVPGTIPNERISPDGRFFAQLAGPAAQVNLVSLKPDEEELAYRRRHTQPNLGRYREGYEAARAVHDNVAARFYLNLLPAPEQKVLTARVAAEREIAAGRTQDALVHLAIVSAAWPEDWGLALKLAALRAWFGQDEELAEMCGRALESAQGTSDATIAHTVARICCLGPTADKARQEAALALARKAVELDQTNPFCRVTLGIAEYRSGHFAEADAALIAATAGAENNAHLAGLSAFFRAMILFRQGKPGEARKLAVSAAKLTGRPQDEKNPLSNPLAGGFITENLIGWLVHKEAKALIQFPEPAEIAKLRQLAAQDACRGDWTAAEAGYSRLYATAPLDGQLGLEYAAVLLLPGDQAGYRKICAEMLERIGQRDMNRYQVARACTLAADSVKDLAPLGKAADELQVNGQAFWALTEPGALAYRAGRYDDAAKHLEQSLKADDKPARAVLNWLWLALVEQRRGKPAEARGWLEKATKWLEQYPKGFPTKPDYDKGLQVDNWLEAHVLRREAEGLLGPKK
jgi:WD40 repeat protein/tetratricopeptide (TPR) repeat protein